MRSVPGSLTGLLSISTWPEVGEYNPAIKWMSVDLPQPDGPTMHKNSPDWTLRSILSKASKRFPPLLLYVRDIFCSATLGAETSTGRKRTTLGRNPLLPKRERVRS